MSPAEVTTGFRSRMKPMFPPGRGREHAGFTMLELVSVIVVIGILAVVLIPRFAGRVSFDTRGYADRVRSALQYAQKVAIAERRNVCVDMSGGPITLRRSASVGAGVSCSDGTSIPLLDPTTGAAFSAGPAVPAGVAVVFSSQVIFDTLGQSVAAVTGTPQLADITVKVKGDFETVITVEKVTGHVH
jgi:MSHA pilin protein MshC